MELVYLCLLVITILVIVVYRIKVSQLRKFNREKRQKIKNLATSLMLEQRKTAFKTVQPNELAFVEELFTKSICNTECFVMRFSEDTPEVIVEDGQFTVIQSNDSSKTDITYKHNFYDKYDIIGLIDFLYISGSLHN